MSKQYDVCILGATGAVGEAMLSILEQRNFPVRNLYPLASSRSAGSQVSFRGKELTVLNVDDFDFSKAQIGLFSAGGSVSEKYAPIAAAAFAGAVCLILAGIISADEAYRGLRPDVLMLIAGMVVLGIALEKTGLAGAATATLIERIDRLRHLGALAILYGATLFATEILSNATVAVLFTPIAVSFAEALGVSPRPFLVAVMIAGSAAFATPFGYQTNVIVYRMGGYTYMDFVRLGIPLNILTWAVAVVAIQMAFPF